MGQASLLILSIPERPVSEYCQVCKLWQGPPVTLGRAQCHSQGWLVVKAGDMGDGKAEPTPEETARSQVPAWVKPLAI